MKVLLYRPKSLIGKLIGFYTRSNYCHVGVLFSDNKIIDCHPGRGVKIRDFTEEDSKICEIYNISSQLKINEEKSRFFAEKQIGKKYDWAGIIGFITKQTVEDRISSQKWICSELLFEIFKKSNIHLLNVPSSWLLSPRDISLSPFLIKEG